MCYYQTNAGKLHLGNCLDILRGFPNDIIDLTITSPPYDDLREYDGYSFDFEPIADELYRVTSKGGVVVWVVSDQTVDGSETGTSFKQALYFKEIGFNIHDTMIYLKPGFSSVGDLSVRYAQVFEYMFVFSKGKLKTFNPLKDRVCKRPDTVLKGTIRNPDGSTKRISTEGKISGKNGLGHRYNVWEINHQANGHPAPFPDVLVEGHILSWSNPGDLILDPFMGSGTTAKMSEKLKRNWIGCEISEKYCELASKRISEARREVLTFGE